MLTAIADVVWFLRFRFYDVLRALTRGRVSHAMWRNAYRRSAIIYWRGGPLRGALDSFYAARIEIYKPLFLAVYAETAPLSEDEDDALRHLQNYADDEEVQRAVYARAERYLPEERRAKYVSYFR